MKIISTAGGVFGPYRHVEVLGDRYRVDGADLQFDLIGGPGVVEDWLGGLPPPLPPVPDEVTMRQAREALIRAGLIGTVEAAINAIADPLEQALARNTWEKSQVVQRRNGLVEQLAPLLGLTEEAIDDLFRQAATY